jgi:O-methyltransferase
MKHIFALVKQRHFLVSVYYVATMPFSIMAILGSRRIHPAYKITRWKKLRLGFRFFLNGIRIQTGTTYKTHLAMALKLFETPPDVEGDVIECGTWKGGSAANLSLACRIVGRKLRIFDSFEGLPAGDDLDREAKLYKLGDYAGSLDEVRGNIQKYGAPECCEFVRGWFKDTLPKLRSPVILAFLDVDLEASLDTCVRYIYPNLTSQGFIFIDEVTGTDYCALFYSERWWKENFNRTPPGLIGAGVGLALGEFYIGPGAEVGDHPMQHSNAGAYMYKDMSGYWTYYPAP